MINPQKEQLLTLDEAAKDDVIVNLNGGRVPHRGTILRHMINGILNARGERIYLEHFKAFRGVRTSREALDRFVAKLNPDPASEHARSPRRRKPEKLTRAERTSRKLQAMGA